jgi:hypothetical protein
VPAREVERIGNVFTLFINREYTKIEASGEALERIKSVSRLPAIVGVLTGLYNAFQDYHHEDHR